MAKNKTLTANRTKTNLMVEIDIWENVKKIAMAKKQSYSEFVMEIIKEDLKRNEREYKEILRRYYKID